MATSVWRGHLTFGLVSIPVRLFKAARSEKVRFHQLHKSSPRESTPAPAPLAAAPPSRSEATRPDRARTSDRSRAAEAPAPPPVEEYTRIRQSAYVSPSCDRWR
jgi:hypothetical protein